MDWCCLLAQNAPLQAVLLLDAALSASSLAFSSKGSTSLGSFISAVGSFLLRLHEKREKVPHPGEGCNTTRHRTARRWAGGVSALVRGVCSVYKAHLCKMSGPAFKPGPRPRFCCARPTTSPLAFLRGATHAAHVPRCHNALPRARGASIPLLYLPPPLLLFNRSYRACARSCAQCSLEQCGTFTGIDP